MVIVPLGQTKMSKIQDDIKLANFTPMHDENLVDNFFVMISESS